MESKAQPTTTKTWMSTTKLNTAAAIYDAFEAANGRPQRKKYAARLAFNRGVKAELAAAGIKRFNPAELDELESENYNYLANLLNK